MDLAKRYFKNMAWQFNMGKPVYKKFCFKETDEWLVLNFFIICEDT